MQAGLPGAGRTPPRLAFSLPRKVGDAPLGRGGAPGPGRAAQGPPPAPGKFPRRRARRARAPGVAGREAGATPLSGSDDTLPSAGLAYSNLVYDWVKAAVLFGVVSAVARLDHLDPPQPPKCITALYVFAET